MSSPDLQQADLLGDEPWKWTKERTNSYLARPAKLSNIYQKLFFMVALCSESKTSHYLNVTCSRHPFLSWLSFFSLWSFVSRRSFLALGRKFKILTSQQTKACESNISSEGFIFAIYLSPFAVLYTNHFFMKT